MCVSSSEISCMYQHLCQCTHASYATATDVFSFSMCIRMHVGYIFFLPILTYMQSGEDFISLYNQTYSDKVLWPTSFRGSPDSALREIYSRDINIIFGFFDSEIARKVLCRVSYMHVYIKLTGYNIFNNPLQFTVFFRES